MRGHRLHRLPAFVRRPAYLVIGMLLFLILVPVMFSLGVIAGIGFIISCMLALYGGVLSRDGRAVLFIALGYALTSYAFRLLWPFAYGSWQQQSFLTFILVCVVLLAVWWRARRLKAGRH